MLLNQEDFDELVGFRDIAIRAKRILEDTHFSNQILNKKINEDHGENIGKTLLGNLKELRSIYEAKAEQLSAGEFDWRRERLLAVLIKADIAHLLEVDEETDSERWDVDLLAKYHDLLTHSIKGFGIVLTRDVDECWINKYNPEFLEIWDGNIDVALVFDMYAVVTYIADYYMKVRQRHSLLHLNNKIAHFKYFRTTQGPCRC